MSDLPKLVRDKIPAIIALEGRKPVYHPASSDEIKMMLRKKLVEEACEFAETGTPDELADVLEVIDAIRRAWGVDFNLSVAQEKAHKLKQRGGFKERYILERIDDRGPRGIA